MPRESVVPGHFMNDVQIFDRGTHIKEIELELTITDRFTNPLVPAKNPSSQFWKDIFADQKHPIILEISNAWVGGIEEEVVVETAQAPVFRTRVRIQAKVLGVREHE